MIGNPPYVRSQFIESKIKNYLTFNYPAASYQPDTFAFFIQKSILVLKRNGYLSYIIPNGILTNTYYSKLRAYILNNTLIKIIVDLKDGVFENASVDTSIFVLIKSNLKNELINNYVSIGEHFAKITNNVITPINKVKQNIILQIPDFAFNSKINSNSIKIINKIKSKSELLGDYFNIKAGMKVRKDFVSNQQEDKRYKKFLLGNNIKPYYIEWQGKWVCYDKSLETKFTNQAFRDETIFNIQSKILIRQVMGKDKIYASLDSKQYYIDQTIYILFNEKNDIGLKYYLGLINSKLVAFYFKNTLSDRKQTFPKIKGAQIFQLPIFINFTDQDKIAILLYN